MKTDHQYFMEYDKEIVGSYNKAYYSIDLIKNALHTDIIEMLDVKASDLLLKEVMISFL